MRNRFFLPLIACFSMMISSGSFCQEPPPPPAHSQTGNQPGTGGTGCPIDRTDGIILTLLTALSYAGVILYQKGKQKSKAIQGND